MTISLIAQSANVESRTDFAPFFRAFRKHVLKIALITMVLTVVPVPFIAKMTAKYLATATVLIKAQADNATPIDPVDHYDSTRPPYYETQYNLMQSRVVLERAVRDMHLDKNPRFNGVDPDKAEIQKPSDQERINHALQVLSRGLTFTIVRQTQLIYISYKSESAVESAQIANGVARAFIQYSVDQKVKKTAQAQAWNTQQVQKLKKQLTDKKQQLKQFLDDKGLLMFHGIDGLENEKMGLITNKLSDAKERRLAAQAAYETMLNTDSSSVSTFASLPEIADHAQLQDLRAALTQAKRKLYELQRLYGPKHQKVLAASAEIQAIESQSRALFAELKERITKKYQEAKIKEQRYQALLREQTQQFRALVEKRNQYNDLMTEIDKTEELYKTLLKRSKEQGLAAQYREPDAILYDPAAVPVKPQKQNKKLLIVMAFVLSLVLSVLVIVVMTAMDRRIAGMNQLRTRLGLIPVGDVPLFDKHSDWVNVVSRHPHAAEIIHGIQTAIDFCKRDIKVLGIASCFPHEGASSIARLIARSVARKKSTLILDLDYRHSTPLNEPGTKAENPGGFAAFVSGASLSTVVSPVEKNLDLLTRGELTDSPLIFFDTQAFTSALDSLAQSYEQLIINMPVIEQSKDSQLLMRVLDSLVVVVKANQYSAPNLQKVIAKLPIRENQAVVGVVNQVKDDDLLSEESRQFMAKSNIADLERMAQR
ncbi:Tyrosine-protein kinase wzc [Vibrio aerogenes CECT 7868]|uniref:Tyrosine-protein kinase wzc n=1 Tax=Vibrio aerogenes CECT 7868 TaxID=1216006 RepID=A0A1M5VSY9_9VIBR|nr:exopolysaccharide transport family protein [Vibrio aerogenes]SHH78327.1 Tyrosine-protein kinase wzc [Vibrio aerogenes CECT 7868]